jgi:pantoate kinase
MASDARKLGERDTRVILTEKQYELLGAIRRLTGRLRRPPSPEELMEFQHVISEAGMKKRLAPLIRKGYVAQGEGGAVLVLPAPAPAPAPAAAAETETVVLDDDGEVTP